MGGCAAAKHFTGRYGGPASTVNPAKHRQYGQPRRIPRIHGLARSGSVNPISVEISASNVFRAVSRAGRGRTSFPRVITGLAAHNAAAEPATGEPAVEKLRSIRKIASPKIYGDVIGINGFRESRSDLSFLII